MARLSKVGRTPSFADGQIAAIAVVNGLTLVTDNVRNFQHFESLEVERCSAALVDSLVQVNRYANSDIRFARTAPQ